MVTLYHRETIEKDLKRIVGKRNWDKWYKSTEIPCAIGGDEYYGADIEYYFPYDMRNKIVAYMKSHRRSRLYRSWTGCCGDLRFKIYGY